MPLNFHFRFRRNNTPSTSRRDADDEEDGASTSHGWFMGASNIVINRPTMVDKPKIIQNFDQGKTVLELLIKTMTPGAAADSSVRYPPPRCYPGTRTSLTTEIKTWLFSADRAQSMMWLHGPPGVGKSAIAQSIAEFAEEKACLGASFFFSGTRNDPNKVFPTLAYQFAVRIPEYKQIITAQLAHDPDILDKAPRLQFKKLIVEPFVLLRSRPRVLIILDGLDECLGNDMQCEIVELINEVVCSPTPLPLLWMICSRPEPHLTYLFFRAHFQIACWKEELFVDEEESKGDVEHYIREELKNIHGRYAHTITEDEDGVWPPEEVVVVIIEAASGLFVFASTVLKFIGDSNMLTRRANLRLLSLSSNTLIFSAIPTRTLPATLILLGAYIVNDETLKRRGVQVVANLLGYSRREFYSTLSKLHSILGIPAPEEAASTALGIFHKSLGEYLTDPARSGRFHLDKREVHSALAKGCLRLLFEDVRSTSSTPSFICWPAPAALDNDKIVRRYVKFFLTGWTWKNCVSEGDHVLPHLVESLREYDFGALDYLAWQQGAIILFMDFLSWLYEVSLKEPQLNCILRTERKSDRDDELLAYGRALMPNSIPFDFEHDLKAPLEKLSDPPRLLLLGYDGKTALVSFCVPIIGVYSPAFPPASQERTAILTRFFT
ncbi:hypothetical protein P691DRAFT_775351 [Macrolepiota fuliginosa MF-IS2]|uniref:Nephrocystin 3-like N-terminal domain-containing protein n=1 Tax=Macrolepiota fuliginosa MF-IS2 TaxID=1400762 RepID=A0A9P6C269_9AGAR|nr:hypothetical protein P691DRAFT_775351 [Macrolepiota fuliginosa MF-IS2]